MNQTILLFSLLGLITIPLASDAFAHGLGSDQAEPIDLNGQNVTVRTDLTPSDITAGQIPDANIGVRFFNSDTDINLNDVAYRIHIYRSGDLIARELFYAVDGVLDVKVKPVYACTEPVLIDCTSYGGFRHPIAGGLYAFGEGRPTITGPIFDKGGLYNIQIDIEGATSPVTLVTDILEFDTFVSVAQEQDFLIQNAYAEEIPIVVKTYYDEITSFDYSLDDDSISFDMPFDWDPQYIAQVPLVHQEVRVPHSFQPYKDGTGFKGYVNGVEVESGVLVLDSYSSYEDQNIIHFLVYGSELERINKVLGTPNPPTMTFTIVPQGVITKNSLDVALSNIDTGDPVGSSVNISWDSNYGASDTIPFVFAFFDENKNPIQNTKFAYSLVDVDSNVIHSAGDDPKNIGIDAVEGITTQDIVIPSQDKYQFNVWLLGQGIVIDSSFNFTYTGKGATFIEVGSSSIKDPPATGIIKDPLSAKAIPSFVKTSAGLWDEGEIDGDTFITSLQYLIQEGIIIISDTIPGESSDNKIPSWFKDNAGFWFKGEIDDDTFITSLQYLIQEGIIVL